MYEYFGGKFIWYGDVVGCVGGNGGEGELVSCGFGSGG